MSVLTKVFVVLVTVLSVALMGVVLANVASQENYKEQTGNLSAMNKILEERVKTEIAKNVSLAQANTVQLEKQTDAMNALQDALQKSQNALAAAQTDAQASKDRLAEQTALVAVANNNVKQTTMLQEAAQNELVTLRKENLDSKTKQIELASKLSEVMGQNEGLAKEVRFLQEANSRQKDEMNALRVKLAGTGGTSGTETVAPVAPTGLRGQVTVVDTGSGTKFVQVNIGSADGVQPGMKFYVYSTTKPFLGQLVIQKVDDRVSAGFIQSQTGTIGVGDSVLAGS